MKVQDQTPVFSEFASDPDFEELLEMFVETIDERKGTLEKQFQNCEIDGLQVTAHQLKGAGGGYGFDGLSLVAAQLEEACKASDVDRVGETLDSVLCYMNRIKA